MGGTHEDVTVCTVDAASPSNLEDASGCVGVVTCVSFKVSHSRLSARTSSSRRFRSQRLVGSAETCLDSILILVRIGFPKC